MPPLESGADTAATPVRHSLANGVSFHPSSSLRLRTFANDRRQVESTPDAPPPAYSSPSDDSHVASTVPSRETEYTQDTKISPETEPSVASGTTLATVKAAAGATYEELVEQLARAQDTIARLTQEAQSGLRQRKGASSSDEKSTGGTTQQVATAVRQGTEGVPIQIVAVLCLASFLLAYFFF